MVASICNGDVGDTTFCTHACCQRFFFYNSFEVNGWSTAISSTFSSYNSFEVNGLSAAISSTKDEHV